MPSCITSPASLSFYNRKIKGRDQEARKRTSINGSHSSSEIKKLRKRKPHRLGEAKKIIEEDLCSEEKSKGKKKGSQ
jgi:hypothetical protein